LIECFDEIGDCYRVITNTDEFICIEDFSFFILFSEKFIEIWKN